MTPRKRSQIEQVIAVLREGPSTAPEVAAETGMSLKFCSAYLCQLVKIGRAVKCGKVARTEVCTHCGHKKPGALASIYGLVDQVRG